VTPVLPSEIKAVIPKQDDLLWDAIVKAFIKLPLLLYRWYRYEYKSDGNFTDAYAKQLCDALKECPKDA